MCIACNIFKTFDGLFFQQTSDLDMRNFDPDFIKEPVPCKFNSHILSLVVDKIPNLLCHYGHDDGGA